MTPDVITGRDLPPLPALQVSENAILRKPFRFDAFLEAVSQLVAFR
jgi:hypothetical protein